MKSDNFVIVFGILITAFALNWNMKALLLQKTSYTRICYNHLADSALEDGLAAGAAYDSSSFPSIDEECAVRVFKRQLLKGFDLEAGSPAGEQLLSNIACIVILQNHYFTVITEQESRQFPYCTALNDWNIEFYMDGRCRCRHLQTNQQYSGTESEIRTILGLPDRTLQENTASWKTQVITDCVEQKVKESLRQNSRLHAEYEILFPDIQEEACHTLEGISMLSFMQYKPYTIDGHCFHRFTLSGARLFPSNDL